MQLEWFESRDFQWMLTDKDSYVLAQIKHYPTGWKLSWRSSTMRGTKFQDKDWPDTELEEAKAWALAMIRMSQ